MRFLALAAPFLTIVAALALRDRFLAITAFFCYLSVEGLLKLLSGYHPVVHIGADIVLWSLLAIWFAQAVLSRRAGLPKAPFITLLLLHVTWLGLLVFSPYTASLYVGVASLKIHLSMIPLYLVGYLIASEADVPRKFLRLMTIFWCGAFVLTLVQYAGGPDSLFDLGGVYLGRLVGFHEWRPFGTTALPGGESVFAFMALPFALCLVLRGDYRMRDPWIILTLVLSAAVFFVSGVRQVFLGSLIIVLTMVGLQVMYGRGRAAAVLISVVIIGAATYMGVRTYILPQAERSIAEATNVPQIWRERTSFDRFSTLLEIGTYTEARTGGLALIWDRVSAFPFGAGLGRTGSAAGALEAELTRDPLGQMIQERYGFQDNFFAAMLVETGIPGTVMLTGMLIGFLILAARLARWAPDLRDRSFAALTAGYMLALLVMSWGSQPLLSNPTLAFFWFLAGLLGGRLRAAEESVTISEPRQVLEPLTAQPA